MENHFENVRVLVRNAKTKKALSLLRRINKENKLGEENTIELLEGRFSNLKNKEITGIEDSGKQDVELNKIHKAILNKVDDLERQVKKVKSVNASDEFIKKIKSEDEFTFLLVGTTGVGKSSTINNLLGEEIAKVGDYEPTTMEVKHFRLPIDGYDFHVVDTPGLCDDLPEKGNDEKYINLIIKGVKHVDALLYVANLGDKRVRQDEKRGINLITNSFGKDIWKNSIIVFTFSNSVPLNKFDEALTIRTSLIRRAIEESGVPVKMTHSIPSVAIDNLNIRNPDGKEWLGELYTSVAEMVSEKGFAKFMMGTIKRVKVSDSSSRSSNRVNVTQTINISRDQERRVNKTAEKKGFFTRTREVITKTISSFKKWLGI